MLVRLVEEKEISQEDSDSMKCDVIATAASLGFDDMIYRPRSEDKERITYGHYVNLAEQLHKDGLISDGKYEELLLQAFRSDIVYGINDIGGGLID